MLENLDIAKAQDKAVCQSPGYPTTWLSYGEDNFPPYVSEVVMDALGELEIAEKAKAYPCELSGGQQQRAAIARAIVKQPSLILADEPTGALDEATGEAVQEIFRRLNGQGRTVVIVTHDARVAGSCGRMISLKDGRVEERGGRMP